MRTSLKIILIGTGFFLFLLLFGIAKSFDGIGGLIGILLMIGFYAGAKAIWKYNPEKKEDSSSHELDKS
jgi:hypothetical protein